MATRAESPAIAATDTWGELLRALPATPENATWVQFEKPAEALRARGLQPPGPGADDTSWLEFYKVSATSEGLVGFDTLMLGVDVTSAAGGLRRAVGVDPATVEAVVWAGRSGTDVAMAGGTDPATVERNLRDAHGDALVREEQGSAVVFSWGSETSAVGDMVGLLGPPVFTITHVAVLPGLVLASSSGEGLQAMLDSWETGTGLAADPQLRMVVERLEADGAVSATVMQLDGEVIYQHLLDRGYGDVLSDPAGGGVVLLPYERLAIGWRSGEDVRSDRSFVGMFVLANGSAEEAVENADRLSAIVTSGRSALSGAPWSDTGMGPVHETSAEETLSIVVAEGLVSTVSRAIHEQDALFASRSGP